MRFLIGVIFSLSFGVNAFAATADLLFQNNTLDARLTWENGPQVSSESVLRIDWFTTSNQSPANVAFDASIFMPAMGHGSAPPKIVQVLDHTGLAVPGAYRVSGLYFTMEGLWNVNVTLKPSAAQPETKTATVAVGAGIPPLQPPAGASTNALFSSPALQAICASGVTPHPTRPGFWHLDTPSFALSDQYLFATMDLPPTPAGEYTVVKVDRKNPTEYTEVARFLEPIQAISFHNGQLWVLFSQKLMALDP